MKKIILEILLGIGLPAAIFHTQLTGMFTAEKPVNKEVSISITRDSNYDAPAYDKTLATVQVVVFTVKNHQQKIVWSKVYDTMPVRQYPVDCKTLRQTVKIKNIHDRKEQLYVTYIITYNTKGSIIKMENGTAVLKGETQGKLAINI